MARLLAIGDIHVGKRSIEADVRCALDHIASLVSSLCPDAVMVLGDIFDGRSTPAERALIGDWLATIAKHTGQVVLIRGNHDPICELQIYSHYEKVTVAEQALLLPLRDGVTLLALPWPDRRWLAAQRIVGETQAATIRDMMAVLIHAMVAEAGSPVIIAGHCEISNPPIHGTDQVSYTAAFQVPPEIFDVPHVLYTILGHIHAPAEVAPRVRYAGSICITDWGAPIATPCSVVELLTTPDTDGEVTVITHPVPGRRWVSIDAHVDEAGAIVEDVTEGKHWVDSPLRDYVRYRYHCTEDQAHLFDVTAIRQRFAGTAEQVVIIPEIERGTRIRAPHVVEAPSIEEKILRWAEMLQTPITESLKDKLQGLLTKGEEHD